MLKDNPVTNQDVNVALKIWGPSVALLKGKTVQRKASMLMQDIMEVLKVTQQNQTHVMLIIDIFFINRTPYFVTPRCGARQGGPQRNIFNLFLKYFCTNSYTL